MSLIFKPVGEDQLATLHTFIVKLATYEQRVEDVTSTTVNLKENLLGTNPLAYAFLILENTAHLDNTIGFCLYYFTYSTFSGTKNLYLEDLFISDQKRNLGYGKQAMAELARIAVNNNCSAMHWSVLDWNESAMNFYQRIGATPKNGSVSYQLDSYNLSELADEF